MIFQEANLLIVCWLANNSLAPGLNYKTSMFYFWKPDSSSVLFYYTFTEATKTNYHMKFKDKTEKISDCAKAWKIGQIMIWDNFKESISMSVHGLMPKSSDEVLRMKPFPHRQLFWSNHPRIFSFTFFMLTIQQCDHIPHKKTWCGKSKRMLTSI